MKPDEPEAEAKIVSFNYMSHPMHIFSVLTDKFIKPLRIRVDTKTSMSGCAPYLMLESPITNL